MHTGSVMRNPVQSHPDSVTHHWNVRDDDIVDQLHHVITVGILIICSGICGFQEFIGEPITCWNDEFNLNQWKHYQDHINSYCWSNSLYTYPNQSNKNIVPYVLNPAGGRHNVSSEYSQSWEIHYIRWLTIVFLAQALMFKMPNMLWEQLNAYSGSNMAKMVEMLRNIAFYKQDKRKERILQVALFMEKWLKIHSEPDYYGFHFKSIRKYISQCLEANVSNCLSILYLFVKFLYLVNTFLQFAILSSYLKVDFWLFGIMEVNERIKAGGLLVSTNSFPLVTLCHFQVYDQGRAMGKWVQCILTMNLFVDKLFLFIWYWNLLLIVTTTFSLYFWCFKVLRKQTTLKFMLNYLKLSGITLLPKRKLESYSLEMFVKNYLRKDGVFVIRMLSANAGDVVVIDLVEALWNRYVQLKTHKPMKDENEADFTLLFFTEDEQVPVKGDASQTDNNTAAGIKTADIDTAYIDTSIDTVDIDTSIDTADIDTGIKTADIDTAGSDAVSVSL